MIIACCAAVTAAGADVHKSSSSKDQGDKPAVSAEQAVAAAAAAETAFGKSPGYLATTLRNTTVNATNTGNITVTNGNNDTGSGKLTSGPNITRQHSVANSTVSSSGSAHAATATAATPPAAASTGSGSGSKADSQAQPADGQTSGAPVTTLSCVWSKILASKAMAEAQASSTHSCSPPRSGSSTPNAVGGTSANAAATAGASSSNTAAGTEGEGPATASSDESLLTASDAVVHLMPAGKFRLIGEWGKLWSV